MLLAKEPIAREAIHRALLAEGFERIYDPPVTGDERASEWARGASRIAFISDRMSGAGVFLTIGPETDPLAAIVRRICPVLDAAERVRVASAEQRPAKQACAALELRFLGRRVPDDDAALRDAIASVLSPLLLSPHRAVRTATIEAAFALQWPAFDASMAEIGARFPDLDWMPATWAKLRADNDAQDREDAEARARQTMIDALPDLVTARRWDEALSAADKILADDAVRPKHWVAARARAFALQGLGRAWEAAVAACLWRSLGGAEDAERLLDTLAPDLPDDDAIDLAAEILALRARNDGPDPLIESLEALLQRAPSRTDELAFLIGALRLKTYDRPTQSSARVLLDNGTPAAARFAALPHAWSALALARAANDDPEGAEQAYRQALRLLAEPPPQALRLQRLARFAEALDRPDGGPARPLDARAIHTAIRWLHKQRDDKEALIRVVKEQLDLPDARQDPPHRAELLRELAVACTFTRRHDDAIAAYNEAIAAERAAGKEDDGLLPFNLACELARKGDKDPALAALSDAIRAVSRWADKATTDDYFSSLWDDRDFLLTVTGMDAPPPPEEIERITRRALGLRYRGDNDEALREGRRAVAAAELSGDPALLAKALKVHGNALTYLASPDRGIAALERARALAEDALAGDPLERADIRHLLGAAYHAAERFDEAEQRYREALDLRTAAAGEDHPVIAAGKGDLARLAADRGRLDEADALMVETAASLERFLAGDPSPDDRSDALTNRALNAGNRVSIAVQRGAPLSDVLALAEATVTAAEELVAAGYVIPSGMMERLRRVISSALPEEGPDASVGGADAVRGASAERLEALAGRIFVIEEPDPRLRDERLYWMRLRQGVRDLRAQGVDDPTIAEGMSAAIRGNDPGPPVASHPAFEHLAMQFARRLGKKTDLVMVAMAMDLAVRGAQPVEEAIANLESFALANVTEGTEEDDGGEDA